MRSEGGGRICLGRQHQMQLGARGPGWMFVVGAALFAVSIYGLALGGPRWLGPVTPVGGLLMIAGWLWLAARFVRP